jgi:hypothetical protein
MNSDAPYEENGLSVLFLETCYGFKLDRSHPGLLWIWFIYHKRHQIITVQLKIDIFNGKKTIIKCLADFPQHLIIVFFHKKCQFLVELSWFDGICDRINQIHSKHGWDLSNLIWFIYHKRHQIITIQLKIAIFYE